jgi:hypothetical protein
MEKSRVFGGKHLELQVSLDHESWSWKTCQRSLFEDYQTYSLPFPQSGMTQNGQLFKRVDSEHPITADDFSLFRILPTPTAHHSKNNPSTPSAWNQTHDLNIEVAKMKGYDQQTIGKELRLHPSFVEWMMGLEIGWTE